MKHKHADIIHAWADGADIQCFNDHYSQWQDTNPIPYWLDNVQYRIKPEEKKPVAWMVLTPDNKKLMLWGEKKPPIFNTSVKLIPLYTAPPSKQEPVVWIRLIDWNLLDYEREGYIPLYTTPASKTWVGLTDVEVAVYETRLSGSGLAREIEAKLRERNK